ncbi:lipase 3-like [Helicoverpa zea]|uniref:lipase 3-like n=1 Tax=Helicoverpa zea TaxID=7113 RepID=UPI001F5661A4|nr:lipase 3-like [Helicoverpa zea]
MEQYPIVWTLYFLILIQSILQIDTSRPPLRPNKLVSYSLPQKRALKKALGINEDVYLNFTELTAKYDYPTEVHTVTTAEGYILKVFRILSKCSETDKQYPVLLLHGIFDTTDLWVVPGTRNGLGYVLADNCYDVWAANHRGNYYSRKHVKLDPDKDQEYWNFTFDEHGNYDLPTFIDYVLRSTGHSKLFFVGHSQGTTDYFVLTSMQPEYNDKIRLAAMLGPVAWMKNLRHPIARIGAQHYMAIKAFSENAGISEILGREHLVHFFLEFICGLVPSFCDLGLSLSTGYKPGSIPLKDISVAVAHELSGTSVKNLAHFSQLILSGRFQRYDEGSEGNLERYGTRKPPQYNVSQITSPILLITAQSDLLSTLKDIDILAPKLPNLVENYVVPEPYWSHHNHLWDLKAPDLVFSKILEYFNKYRD